MSVRFNLRDIDLLTEMDMSISFNLRDIDLLTEMDILMKDHNSTI